MNNWIVAKKTIDDNSVVVNVVSDEMEKSKAAFLAENLACEQAEILNSGELFWTTEDDLKYGVNAVFHDDVLKMFICKDVVITSEMETLENVMVEKTVSKGWLWKSTEIVMEDRKSVV